MIGVPLSRAPLTACNRAREGNLGGGRRRPRSERLLEPGDLSVAVELDRERGGAEHRPGRQRRRDRRHVAVHCIRPRRRRQHRLHPSDRSEQRLASRARTEWAAEGHVIGKHRRQRLECVVGPGRHRVPRSGGRPLPSFRTSQQCTRTAIETRPRWEQPHYLPHIRPAAPTRRQAVRAGVMEQLGQPAPKGRPAKDEGSSPAREQRARSTQEVYRHHKPIVAWGRGREVLAAFGIPLDANGVVVDRAS